MGLFMRDALYFTTTSDVLSLRMWKVYKVYKEVKKRSMMTYLVGSLDFMT